MIEDYFRAFFAGMLVGICLGISAAGAAIGLLDRKKKPHDDRCMPPSEPTTGKSNRTMWDKRQR